VPDADEPTDPSSSEVDRQGDLDPADEVVEGEIAADPPSERSRRVMRAAEFSGPLPPPNALADYDRIRPGLADIIVDQWQLETRHRHETIDGLRATDHAAVQGYYDEGRRGQWMGFIALLGILAVAAYAISQGADLVGLASIVVAGSYAIWALRRESSATTPPTDLGRGDEVENLPAELNNDPE
jgi:uncharacterized membrane protein